MTEGDHVSNSTSEFEVSRVIDATVSDVWRAWCDPDLIRKWWGPTGFSCPRAEVRFREGESTLVTMRSPEAHDIHNLWTYRVIRPTELIEFDSSFADSDGNSVPPTAVGLPDEIPDLVRHVVTLQRNDDHSTLLTVTEFGYPAGPILEMSRAGQEQCMDKLAAALTTAT